MRRNPSTASVKPTGSVKSTTSSRLNTLKGGGAIQRSSSRGKSYDSAQIAVQNIENSQKLILKIKSHQIKKEIDEANKIVEGLMFKYDSCESLVNQLMEKQAMVAKHSKALNRLSLVQDFEFILENLNELASKLNYGLNSAKIRLSLDNFVAVKRLLDEFRNLLLGFPDQEALYLQLEALTKPKLSDGAVRLRADRNWMDNLKETFQVVDQHRMKLKELRERVHYLTNAKTIAFNCAGS